MIAQVGNYRLVRQLGEGGMGKVFLARHLHIDQQVAIKLLRPDEPGSQQPARRQRFLREAGLLARITHPGIVRLLDFGHLDDGSPYLIMELLHGQTLRQRLIDRGRLAVPDALSIARQLADSLVHVHAAQCVHRDLKPENIMLASAPVGADAEGERARLLDFGVARDDTPFPPGDATAPQTQSSELIGTVLYMAREQLLGQQASDRTDVHALGLVLYEMLTGKLPYPPNTTAVMTYQMGNEPPPPLPADPARPRWVDQLLWRMLAREPEERPTMKAVRDRLDGAALPWTWSRSSRRRALRLSRLGALGGTGLLLVAGLAHNTASLRDGRMQRAESAVRDARELARRPDTFEQRRRALLGAASALRPSARWDGESARVLAHVHHRLGDLSEQAGDLQQGRRHQEEARRLLWSWPARGLIPGSDADHARRTIEWWYWEGGLRKQEGRLDAAAGAYDQVLGRCPQGMPMGGPCTERARAIALEGRAEIHWHRGQGEPARRLYQEALERNQRQMQQEPDPEQADYLRHLVAFMHHRLGQVAQDAGDAREARARYDAALAVQAPLVDGPALYKGHQAQVHLQRGLLALAEGQDGGPDIAAALRLADRAQDDPRLVRPHLLRAQCLLGQVALLRGGSDAARALREALEILERAPQEQVLRHERLRALLTHGALLEPREAAGKIEALRAAMARDGQWQDDVHLRDLTELTQAGPARRGR